MRLPPLSFVVLDTETTGFLPRVHRIMEFASSSAEGGKVTEEYDTLIAIPDEIPPHIQILTRIKQDMLAGKPTFDGVRDEITQKLSGATLLVGQNLGYDLSMLKGEGIDLTDRPWVDTSMLASLVFPELRSYSLPYMSAMLSLPHDPPHRALGDVRATMALFAAIWERLLALPPALRADAKKFMARSTEGYRLLFDALPEDGAADAANGDGVNKSAGRTWPFPGRTERETAAGSAVSVEPARGKIGLREECLDSWHLQSVIDHLATLPAHRHFVAVKNLESTLRRVKLPDSLRVLHPPFLLLDPEASARLLAQESFLAEEATLATKIAWFSPRVRSDVSLHGGEKDVWNGKLACTDATPVYRAQFDPSVRAFLLDHRQLLQFLAGEDSAASSLLDAGAHVVIDDASMLEDTATRAYGASVMLDDLRAAAQGNDRLMQLVDTTSLWAEKARAEEDTHFLTDGELRSSATKGLAQMLDTFLADTSLTPRLHEQLAGLRRILDVTTLGVQLKWIEHRISGSLSVHEAPEHIDKLLQQHLFDRFATTLLTPRGLDAFPEMIPVKAALERIPATIPPPKSLRVSFPDLTLDTLLADPPEGKTIVLAGSKHLIEKLYIRYTEELEAKGVTLICQGMSGGMNRMEAEFLAADAPALLLLTPWMYEGIELPPDSADRLVIDQMPFDHPHQPVFQRRKNHYRDAFGQYALPRLTHRLFRLVRTFCRHRNDPAELLVLDKRLFEKSYGKSVVTYLTSLCGDTGTVVAPSKKPAAASPKASVAKDPGPQQTLFDV